MSSEESRVFDAVLEDLGFELRMREGRFSEKVLVSKDQLPGYANSDPRILLGDISNVWAEFDKLTKEPGYTWEFIRRNETTALQRAYPTCFACVIFGQPVFKSADLAEVEYSKWPDGSAHGTLWWRYTLVKLGGQWQVDAVELVTLRQ